MKWDIGIIIFALLMIIYLLRKGIIAGRNSEPINGTIIKYSDPDELMNMSIMDYDLDKMLVEKEIDDVNINYDNYKSSINKNQML